jgi:hypothetical protein
LTSRVIAPAEAKAARTSTARDRVRVRFMRFLLLK